MFLLLSVLLGLLEAAWALDAGCNCTLVKGVDWGEDLLETTSVASAEACCNLCTLQENCLVWSWDAAQGTCFTKAAFTASTAARTFISGYSAEAPVFSVLDFGAVGDGKTDNTLAIQKAIYAAGNSSMTSEESSVVLFPYDSGIFVSGSLFLGSDMVFFIDEGATLQGSRDHSLYPWTYNRAEGTMQMNHAGLLNAGICLALDTPLVPGSGDQCTNWTTSDNLVLAGNGTIDGQGDAWWDNTTNTRPMLLSLYWVTGLTIRDLHLQDSPFWTVHPTFSQDIEIYGLTITAPAKSPNTDGIDPDSCNRTHIHDCTIDTGDDCIAIKSGKDQDGMIIGMPTLDVLVENMFFKAGHGVSIGSEMSGGVGSVVVRDSDCTGTDRVVRVKSCVGRGGYVQDVLYENLKVNDVQIVVSLSMFYSCSGTSTALPVFKNITARDIQVSSTQTCGEIECLDGSPCTELEFDNIQIDSFSDGYSCENAYGQQSGTVPEINCLQS